MHWGNRKRADNVYENYVKPGRSRREITNRNIQSSELTGNDSVKIRAALVCLVLLCVLLLISVIVLCVTFNQERQQLLTNITNLIQLNENLSKFIQDGWIYYQFGLYYVSNETKNWTESRRYCTERGADLVIIENRQKQDFMKKISNGNDVWIGLTDSEEEGTWKWVDNSTLPSDSEFWKQGEPNGGTDENCAFSGSAGLFDYTCSSIIKWICEKKNIIHIYHFF
ncbi:CD209 antigen-like protein D [Puntigrus tetrazona]|uniref:CD209 antigen-like protein D n=1 Tax=Puntigrus tetrazona TaxID=1606681 RepID=UPI001C8ADDA9|nr:CD209 antigen-like protein D [Puntigrus tetrazona]